MYTNQHTRLAAAVALTAAAIAGLVAIAASAAAGVPAKPAAVSVFIPGDPPAGIPPEGTQILTVDPVFDPGSGDPIGTAVTRVVIAEVTDDDAVFILDCTVRLDDGTLTFYGAESFSSFADGVIYTVMGGTGRYHGTRGVVNITAAQVEGQNGSLLTFDLTRR